MEPSHPRKVRSFVRRPGRITSAQRKALENLLPRYGIAFERAAIDLTETFGRDTPRVLDIGFGVGEALFSLAVNHPEVDYLGVEVHEPGIGHLLLLLERANLENVRIINRDVIDVMGDPRLLDRYRDRVVPTRDELDQRLSGALPAGAQPGGWADHAAG